MVLTSKLPKRQFGESYFITRSDITSKCVIIGQPLQNLQVGEMYLVGWQGSRSYHQ